MKNVFNLVTPHLLAILFPLERLLLLIAEDVTERGRDVEEVMVFLYPELFA
ncbi:MAG: hypothetical protein LN563_06410 [Rickettsia endosymbiont of Platyusa sonomae]|nr:hypothetical protein [Rickettsia endosymbiont of Platyusa sonomae]